MDDVTLRFLESTRLKDNQDCGIERVLKLHLPSVTAELGVARVSDDVCFLADAGDTLVYLLEVLSRLANIIAHGAPSTEYVEKRISESAEEDDLSTLGIVDYLDDKHAALKTIAANLSDTASRSRRSWALSPARLPSTSPPFSTPPQEEGSQSKDSEADSLDLLSLSGTRLDQYRVTSTESVASSRSPSSPSFVRRSSDQSSRMDPLSARGKGQYTCPEGGRCTKGGVQPNGSMVVFERNSAFRAHLQKHEKRYRCDLPGCTNKTGFARIDQLERHKQTVKHG